MEIEAATAELRWLSNTSITREIIVSDSVYVEKGTEWLVVV